jgi:hypothetical protein
LAAADERFDELPAPDEPDEPDELGPDGGASVPDPEPDGAPLLAATLLVELGAGRHTA